MLIIIAIFASQNLNCFFDRKAGQDNKYTKEY